MNIIEYADKMSNILLEIALDLGYLSRQIDDKEVYEGISDIVDRIARLAGVEPIKGDK